MHSFKTTSFVSLTNKTHETSDIQPDKTQPLPPGKEKAEKQEPLVFTPPAPVSKAGAPGDKEDANVDRVFSFLDGPLNPEPRSPAFFPGHNTSSGSARSSGSFGSDVSTFDNDTSQQAKKIRALVDELTSQSTSLRETQRAMTIANKASIHILHGQKQAKLTKDEATDRLPAIKELCAGTANPDLTWAKVLVELSKTTGLFGVQSGYRDILYGAASNVLHCLIMSAVDAEYANGANNRKTSLLKHIHKLLGAYPDIAPDEKYRMLDILIGSETLDDDLKQKAGFIVLEEIEKTSLARTAHEELSTNTRAAFSSSSAAKKDASLMSRMQIEKLQQKLPDMTLIMNAKLHSLAQASVAGQKADRSSSAAATSYVVSEARVDRRLRQLLKQIERPQTQAVLGLKDLDNRPTIGKETKFELLEGLLTIRDSFPGTKFYQKLAAYFDITIFSSHSYGESGLDDEHVNELRDAWNTELSSVAFSLRKAIDKKSFESMRKAVDKLRVLVELKHVGFSDASKVACVLLLKKVAMHPKIEAAEAKDILGLMRNFRESIEDSNHSLEAFPAILEVLCKKNDDESSIWANENPREGNILAEEAGRLNYTLGEPVVMEEFFAPSCTDKRLSDKTKKMELIAKLPFVADKKTAWRDPQEAMNAGANAIVLSTLGQIVGKAIKKLGKDQHNYIKIMWTNSPDLPGNRNAFLVKYKPAGPLGGIFSARKKSDGQTGEATAAGVQPEMIALPASIRKNREETAHLLEAEDTGSVDDDGYDDFLDELMQASAL